jgi:hypothetical protein
MSYAGMGIAAFSLTPKSFVPTSTTTTTTADKGSLPPDLVTAIALPLTNASFAASDATGQKLRVLGVLLSALVRNAKGAPVSAQAVLPLLTSLLPPAGSNSWINNAFASSDYAPLRSMTAESLISDITSGKYKASAPPSTATLQRAPLLHLTGGSTLSPQTTSSSAPPPVSPAQPEVQCTDGYFRDYSGLCVPNAAPPGPAAQPDASQTTPPPAPLGPDGLPLCPPGMYRYPDGNCGPVGSPTPIDSSGETRTCPDGSLVPLIGGTCPPGAVTTPAGFMSSAPLGVSLKWWALGAAGLGIAAIAYRSSKKSVVANKRRRRKRS